MTVSGSYFFPAVQSTNTSVAPGGVGVTGGTGAAVAPGDSGPGHGGPLAKACIHHTLDTPTLADERLEVSVFGLKLQKGESSL